jgi:hypothetical protein
MNAIIALLSALFNVLFWVIFFAVLAIIYLCRWLHKLSTTQEADTELEAEEEFGDDDPYGCTRHISCVNCDLVEQCKGWSPRKEECEENDTKSDFFMFNHLLDSDDKHDEKEHHVHDSFNCDDAWCECHERDGYSWFDENGNDVDGDDSVW